MIWGRILVRLRAIGLTLLLLLILSPPWPAFRETTYQIEAVIAHRQYDFLVWELDALLTKAKAWLTGSHQYLDSAAQQQLVLDYLSLLQETQQLNDKIDQLYTDPGIIDPAAESASLQQKFVANRVALAEQQPLAEAIVQDQVGQILVEAGFGVAGRPFPPVLMHMSPLPSLMMVSPRDRVERLHSYSLVNGLTTPEKDEMETAVYAELGLSALVVPIGGLGTFPAMIQETSNLNWLVEVTTHEWSHHWMSFYPIGINYTTNPDVRIMNETTASIIDREIADLVIQRFYPQLVPPPQPETPIQPITPDPNLPPPFDFQAEMAETRIEVDRLLAAGKIETAEAYMEARRQFFFDNGFAIRKLNQAYFAFYGAYAAVPGGAAGADPIGPAVREVRALSPSLKDFMQNMSWLTSMSDLEQLVASLR